MTGTAARISVDIGGTFTDIAVENNGHVFASKVLTNAAQPEKGMLRGIELSLHNAGLAPSDVRSILHGTTLATNALIERKGAQTIMITTEGFRDVIEIAYEHRYAQYDIKSAKAAPLVPRPQRLTISERIHADGSVRQELSEDDVHRLIPKIMELGAQSIAICLLHSHINNAHEQKIREILHAQLPDLYISLSSEVCPEIREYDRFITTCANAYVQPLVSRYLALLRDGLRERGFKCPLFLVNSGGGLTSVDLARRFPIRLVESGPVGGAILAAHVARQHDAAEALSFDMGGTTAKLALIDEGAPSYSHVFEVDRQYRFMKGSGFPVRIPVVDMVEIGAGGGSLISSDRLGRITVGPQSASSTPGPACYGKGGLLPTVTDANVVLGRLNPDYFGNDGLSLDVKSAQQAFSKQFSDSQSFTPKIAASGADEIVNENMASAARIHTQEQGKLLSGRVLIAFGGCAPLHATSLADKLGIDQVVIPQGAGIGSSIGFLRMPAAYQVSHARIIDLNTPNTSIISSILQNLETESRKVIEEAVGNVPTKVQKFVDLRYLGQGHEITVTLPSTITEDEIPAQLDVLFTQKYQQIYNISFPHLPIQITGFSVHVAERDKNLEEQHFQITFSKDIPSGPQHLVDITLETVDGPQQGHAISRQAMIRNKIYSGPLLIIDPDTTTVVLPSFTATLDTYGDIILTRICAESN
ncbi:hydantoinase/oxoprolinase family protein [Acetobacter okinawensis]|uniref:hydantoinase/oxoprolinase family protein n=1 Tax=Acetobacter okinawensis TaxID=1076594 RepID=UPI001BAC96A7|nr:hydantoinase/oxoprolinase family protein [Acetobacter okinawensis]MBS0967032.1 hydantoinase/oxoprolinase family protein [Acetobacter okinawensis]MBS0987952.1 hydantoinase/oxoprolinase family protein [Acetobacter okinawensis]